MIANQDIKFDEIKCNIHQNYDYLEHSSKNVLLNTNQDKDINNSFPLNLSSFVFKPFEFIFEDNNSEIILSKYEQNIKNISLGSIKQIHLYEIEKDESQNNSLEILVDNPNKIFTIKKELKKGRLKKDSNKKGKHDKYQRDNIIRRFKVHLMRNIFKYVNNSFNVNNPIYKTKINVLKKISSHKIKSISKKDNIKWLDSKIKDVFSQDLTTKIVTCKIDYNIKLIKGIINKGKDKKIIYILNKTVRNFWEVYINNDKYNEFDGFQTIKDDIISLRKLGETEEYINLFIEVAHNFEDIFKKITPRKERKQKTKNN